MYNSRLLTLFGGKQRYVDTFDVLPARLVPVVGTLAVSGGALQAASAGDWLKQLLANVEFTANTTGWTPVGASSVARVDSEVDPGVNSGGADKWALQLTGGAAGDNTVYQVLTSLIIGSRLRYGAVAYKPTATAGGRIQSATTGVVSATTISDAWQALSCTTGVLAGNTDTLWFRIMGAAAAGEIIYGDAFAAYRQNTPALVAGWQSPNFVATLGHISPASPSVVPFSWLCRYTDSLNYWEIRVLPNTAGADLAIYQVTAGVETSRGTPVDVDWTAGGTDELEVSCLGATISTRYKKSGGVWAAGPSYASATQGQGSPKTGPMFWRLSTNRLMQPLIMRGC